MVQNVADQNHLMLITLMTIVLSFLVSWSLVKLLFHVVYLKYKLRVSFKLNLNNLQLTHVEVVKHGDEDDKSSKSLEIYVQKMWISSCYLNRNVADTLLVCINSVNINLVTASGNQAESSGSLMDIIRMPAWLAFYLKYVGCVQVEHLNVNLNQKLSSFTKQITVKYTNKHPDIIEHNLSTQRPMITFTLHDSIVKYSASLELFVNKLAVYGELGTTKASHGSVRFELDSANLHLTWAHVPPLDQLLSRRSSNKTQLNALIGQLARREIVSKITVGRLMVNNRYELDGLSVEHVRGTRSYYVRLDSIDSFKRDEKILLNLKVDYDPTHGRLDLNSQFMNVYVNLVVFEQLRRVLMTLNDVDDVNMGGQTRLGNIRIVTANTYVNLIDDRESIVYTLGCRRFRCEANVARRTVRLTLADLMLFRSNLKRVDKFSNNLFQLLVDRRGQGLVDLFRKINELKFMATRRAQASFNHSWGNLLNVNTIRFTLDRPADNKDDQCPAYSLIVDQLFVEYSHEFVDFFLALVDLSQIAKGYLSRRNLQSSTTTATAKLGTNLTGATFNFKLNQSNIFYLFERNYFIHFSLKDIVLVRTCQCTDKLNLKLNQASLLQYRIADIIHKQQQCDVDTTSTTSTLDEELAVLNRFDIEYFKDNENLNLIFLFKCIQLNLLQRSEYYLTVNDVLCTWSLKIHFILNEILFKHIHRLKSLSLFGRDKSTSNDDEFTLKILIESNMLVNFLFDYSQDSSKVDASRPVNAPGVTYFNSNFSLIETLSIILNDVLVSRATDGQFELYIGEVCMFINVDDQSLYSLLNEDEHASPADDSLSTTRRNKFFQATTFTVCSSNRPSDRLLAERKLLNTQLESNRLVDVNANLIVVNFLFKYDFAKWIDHTLNVRKCLLSMHDVRRSPAALDADTTPVSSDFTLQVRQFKMVIEDDPFEVKLAYNYALIADEHLESVKRRKTLDQRRLIKENNLEQYALEMLREREAKIYLQRSNRIYSSTAGTRIRTELFTFTADNISLYALSDVQWHGRRKCYDILRQIDASSAPPQAPQGSVSDPNGTGNAEGEFDPAAHYSILWCRQINFNVGEFKFSFRDYTQPLLKMSKLCLFGKLLGSEYEASYRTRRSVRIGISSELSHLNYCVFHVERSMSPFKFYYDLSSKINFFSFAYGPCWEGCMAQLNLSLDKIIHPARDPSKPMPWWDKTRLYLHGRLTSLIQQCHIIYHVSMDPYNRTEEMKLVWTQLYFDWTNMQMILKGILDVYLNTESKYDDCCLLHLPDLELKINIDWLCKTQLYSKSNPATNDYHLSSFHNHVMPCAPDKIPVVINSFEHDSYARFRSENVNLSFSIVCRLSEVNREANNLPTCKFYASTSRFLERIKTLLSAITRPTKRGKLFRNLKPRKPILSRHFKLVNFNIEIPDLKLIYWSSASEQYGIQVDCNEFKLGNRLKLELIPFVDTLKRRPRPNWSIELMKFSLENINIYLMSASNNVPVDSTTTTSAASGGIGGSSSGDRASGHLFNQAEHDLLALEMNERSVRFLDAKPAVRNFFMKIDSIYYEREKNAQYNAYQMNTNNNVQPDLIGTANSTNVSGKSYGEPKKLNSKFSYSFRINERPSSYRLNEKPSTGSFKQSKHGSSHHHINSSQHHHQMRNSLRSGPRDVFTGGRSGSYRFDSSSSLQANMPNTANTTLTNVSMTSLIPFQVTNAPKHNLLVKNLKAKWNNANRDVLYILYEIYYRSKRLRHNLSSQALKQYDLLTDQIIQNHLVNNYKFEHLNHTSTSHLNASSKGTKPSDLFSSCADSASSAHQASSGQQQQQQQAPPLNGDFNSNKFFEELLNKLDAERLINLDVYCDEKTTNQSTSNFTDMLYGLNAINKMSDVLNENVFIELINSQIKLSLDECGGQPAPTQATGKLGQPKNNLKQQQQQQQRTQTTTQTANTNGYLIISAARTNVVQRIHKPVWKYQRYLEKNSWSGYLENMQYFATLNKTEPATGGKVPVPQQGEYWLSDEVIDPGEPALNAVPNPIIETQSFEECNEPTGQVEPAKSQAQTTAAQKKPKKGLGFILNKNANKNQANSNSTQSTDESSTYYTRQQLQLIVPKCCCEFYMIDFDDKLPDGDENLNDSLPTVHNTQTNNANISNKNNPFLSTSSLNLNQTDLAQYLYAHFQSTSEAKTTTQTNNHHIDLNSSFNDPIDCFTLIHHDLNLCTNSQQYKLIMELVNNLVLYFRPRRKQVIDRQKSIKFNLQLSMANVDSLKHYIQCKQIETKELLCKLRALEKRLFHLKEKIEAEINDYNVKHAQSMSGQSQQAVSTQIYVIHELKLENKSMEKQYRECKKALTILSEELNISISCYKEIMIEKRAINLAQTPLFVQHVLSNTDSNKLVVYSSPLTATTSSNVAANTANKYTSLLRTNSNPNDRLGENGANEQTTIDLDQLAQQSILNNEIAKRYEIWFKNIKWKLNDDDAQTGLALFLMKNFLYTKVTNHQELDCVEHTLEMESCRLEDLTKKETPTPKSPSPQQQQQPPQPQQKVVVLSSLFDVTSNSAASDELINMDLNSTSTSQSSTASMSHSSASSVCSKSISSFRSFSGEHISPNSSGEHAETSGDQHKTSSHSQSNNNNNSNDTSGNSSGSGGNNLKMFRIYCKERPPVGIPVFEHLELNVSPLLINLTNRFYKTMIKFFFDNQTQPQMQIYTNMNSASNTASVSSSSSSSAVVVGSSSIINRNTFQRQSYNDDQFNAILNLNIGNNSNGNSMLTPSISPISGSNGTSNTNAPNTNMNTTNTSVNNTTSGLISNVQSPSSLKNLLSHHKKPSQSSIKSSSTQIMLGNVSILANSNSNSNSANNVNGLGHMSNSQSNMQTLTDSTVNNASNTSSNSNNANSSAQNSTNAQGNNAPTGNQLQIEDIEIMKQRSANNNTFLCIKIPEIQLLVSYKGSNKDKKNIKDLTNVSLLFPLFELHDKTLTWLDLINTLKSHVKKALLSQALKHKLIKAPIKPVNRLINRNRRSNSQQQLSNFKIDENEKLTISKLFGVKFIESKSKLPPLPSNKEEPYDKVDDLAAVAEQHKQLDNLNFVTTNMDHIVTVKKSATLYEKRKPANIAKSNSTLSSEIKRHFLKFTRDRESSDNLTSDSKKDQKLSKRKSNPK